MDTGEYMAGQMDRLIEASQHQMEQEYDEMFEHIEKYIKECNYTWTAEKIIEQYHKRERGEYISHTAKDCVLKFENDLNKFFNYGKYKHTDDKSSDTAFAIHGVSNSVCDDTLTECDRCGNWSLDSNEECEHCSQTDC